MTRIVKVLDLIYPRYKAEYWNKEYKHWFYIHNSLSCQYNKTEQIANNYMQFGDHGVVKVFGN